MVMPPAIVPAVRRHFIGGRWIEATGETRPLRNPATGKVHGQLALGGEAEVEAAVRAARAALEGPWGRMTLAARCDLLDKVADRLLERLEDLVAAEVGDTGKPAHEARSWELPRAAANFRSFAALARGRADEVFRMRSADGLEVMNTVLRAPIGIVGLIVPWNLPLLLLTFKAAPALAMGNVIIAKPSEETPTTACLLAEIMADAGLPDGVFNVVHGLGAGGAGEALVRHPEVRAIAFTGESATGRAIMATASHGLKALSFELGGKNAAIVLEDADLDAAVAGTARSAFLNTGQVCLCTERVYVARPLYETFVARLAEEAGRWVPGDPWQAGTRLGPVISEGQRERIRRYAALAAESGNVRAGGDVPVVAEGLEGGWWFAPTVWTDLGEDHPCVREEVFGPVCHVAPFDTEDEALRMANASPYGLAGVVWTRDLDRALRVSRRLEAGLTWVNSWYLRDLRTPFGGVKASGIGREGGVWSLDFFSETRTICIPWGES
ncbi:MAG: aldehyde dehydrogenase family protein [Candidatus Sericytochromatia bacterium]|nr:aldehyde dehydrogenase family protein [Candidatus Sericytochromatia bacterium]